MEYTTLITISISLIVSLMSLVVLAKTMSICEHRNVSSGHNIFLIVSTISIILLAVSTYLIYNYPFKPTILFGIIVNIIGLFFVYKLRSYEIIDTNTSNTSNIALTKKIPSYTAYNKNFIVEIYDFAGIFLALLTIYGVTKI